MGKKKYILYCCLEWTDMFFFFFFKDSTPRPRTHARTLARCVITVRAAQRSRRGHTVRCINACAQISLVDTHREREERHAGGGSNGAATVGSEVQFFFVVVFFLLSLPPMMMCSCSCSCLPEHSHFMGDTPLEFGRCWAQFNGVN